jgi:DNA transformation protein
MRNLAVTAPWWNRRRTSTSGEPIAMATKDEFAHYCAELLAPVGGVQVRRMFGAHGLYLDGLFVAIVTHHLLYLKADAQSAPQFQDAGGKRFEYEAKGRRMWLGFWTPPDEAMEAPHLMAPWARLAIEAALRSGKGKRG